jgi:hypothetical protein
VCAGSTFQVPRVYWGRVSMVFVVIVLCKCIDLGGIPKWMTCPQKNIFLT